MIKPDYDWWIQNAHKDSAFVLLCTDADEFKRRVRQRANELGREDVQSLINFAMWRAIYEQDRFGGMSTLLDSMYSIPTIPEGLGKVRPINGPLRIEGRAIADNAGPFPALGVSAFWVLWAYMNDPERLERLGRWATQSGMTYVRWFGAYDWEGGIDPKHTPNYFKMAEGAIQKLAEMGLRSQITLFTRYHMLHLGGEKEQYVGNWARLIEEHRDKVILCELVNEADHSHNSFPENHIRDLARRFRRYSQAPLALTAPIAGTAWDDIEDRLIELHAQQSAADSTTIHYPRYDGTDEGPWRSVRQSWHSKDGVRDCGQFLVDNEHARWDKIAGGRIEVAVAASLFAFINSCGMSAHHDVYGVFTERGEYRSPELSKVFRTVMALLPPDLPNWKSVRVPQRDHPFPDLLREHWTFHDGSQDGHGVSRAFAAVKGNNKNFVMVLSGVRDYVKIGGPMQWNFKVISLKDGETVYEGSGPYTAREQDGEAFLVIT